jgi:hypothetical protein
MNDDTDRGREALTSSSSKPGGRKSYDALLFFPYGFGLETQRGWVGNGNAAFLAIGVLHLGYRTHSSISRRGILFLVGYLFVVYGAGNPHFRRSLHAAEKEREKRGGRGA